MTKYCERKIIGLWHPDARPRIARPKTSRQTTTAAATATETTLSGARPTEGTLTRYKKNITYNYNLIYLSVNKSD